jgi:hypothetical protein
METPLKEGILTTAETPATQGTPTAAGMSTIFGIQKRWKYR